MADTLSPEAEVRRLHVFFEGWMAGLLPPEDSAFAPFPAALAPGFTLVGPDGTERDRAGILAVVRDLHGARGSAFRIRIEAARTVHQQPGLAIVRYDECQQVAGSETRRRCTAVLTASAAEHGAWRWLAVHETWVTPSAD